MKRSIWLILMGTLIGMIAGCRGDTPSAETPTPFPSNELNIRALPGAPIPVSLQYLAENPTFFEGATLQISGQYNRLPRLFCDHETQLPPYSYGISDNAVIAQAGGMDDQLRTLLPDGLTITVEGTWLRWEGPVGCGKDAPVKQAWYLAVSRVLDPTPLVKVTLTPGGELISEIIEGQPPTTPTPSDAELMPIETVPSAETPIIVEPLPTATFLPTATQIIPIAASATVTGTATLSETPAISGTVTATTTLTPDPNATVLPKTTPTLTATPIGGSGSPFDNAISQGTLDFRDLAVRSFSNGSSHRWDINNDNEATHLTISVAPGNRTADIALALYTDDGTLVIANIDQAGPGSVETSSDILIDPIKEYVLLVNTIAGSPTDYAVMVQDSDDSFLISFQGRITPDATESGTLGDENDHFWFFNGLVNSRVSITVQPTTGSSDAYLELYDPTGSLITEKDENGSGESELLTDYTLQSTGLFGIRIGEFDYEAMGYTITLSEN